MNDDFLRQPTPPVRAEFATQLKKKLDRQPEPTRTAGLRMALMEMFTMITSTRIRRAGFTLAAAVLAGAAILAVSPQAQAAARDFLIRVAGMSFSTAPAPAVAPLISADDSRTTTPGARLRRTFLCQIARSLP